MTLPCIHITTPSFNQAEFLERTLDSVIAQKYPNLHFGVIDGGSTDGSIEILERYRHQLDFLIIEPDGGQSEAINKGLRQADSVSKCGETSIMGWLNSDDTFMPGTLHRVGEFFAQHPDKTWITGACLSIDADDTPGKTMPPQGDFTLPGTLLRDVPFNMLQPATFWRKSVSDQAGLLDENLAFCMDFELWCRFMASGHTPYVMDQTLATYRFHDASKSCSSPLKFRAALIEIERQYLAQLSPSWQRKLKRRIGYQTRALAIDRAAEAGIQRPWHLVRKHPLWLGSQQVLKALFHPRSAAHAAA